MKRSYIYNLKLSQSVDSMWDLSPPPHTLLCQHATEKAMSNCRKKYVDMQITILKKSESVAKIKKKLSTPLSDIIHATVISFY